MKKYFIIFSVLLFLVSSSVAMAETFDFETITDPIFSYGSQLSTEGYSALGFGDYMYSSISDARFKNDLITMTVSGLESHTSIDINFMLAIVNSWNGNDTDASKDPDFLNIAIDGINIFRETFENFDNDQSYTPPSGVLLAAPSSNIHGTISNWHDSAYNMGLDGTFNNIAHTSDTLTISWLADGAGWTGDVVNSGDVDEFFAIDNVEIVLNGTGPGPDPVPEPTTMLLLGSGLVGLAGFRRKFKKV